MAFMANRAARGFHLWEGGSALMLGRWAADFRVSPNVEIWLANAICCPE